MATRDEKIALIQTLKQQGLGRTEIKAQLEAMDQPQAAKELPSITPEKFGQAEKPSGLEAIFPRATSKGEQTGQSLPFGRKIAGGIADVLSLPGRGVASLVQADLAPKGEKDLRGRLAKTKGDGFIESVVRSPSTGASLATLPISGPIAGGIGLGKLGIAGRGLVEGAASAFGTQSEKFAEEGKVSPVGAIAETALGGIVPGAAKVTGAGAKLGLSTANKLAGKTAPLTGVGEDTLRKFGFGFGQGAKDIKGAAGKGFELGQDLVKRFDNIDDFMPNKLEVDRILQESPEMSTAGIIETLEKAKTANPKGAAKGANDSIDSFIADIRADGDVISAVEYRELRKQIDREIGDQFGKESSAYITALKSARNTAKTSLEGNTPAEFAGIMADYHKKLDIADRLKKELGRDALTREKRAESFINTLFGRGKTFRQNTLREFEEIFGGDFINQSQLVRMATELGEEGVPSLIPRGFTGKTLLGTGLGGGVGGKVGAAVGAGLSSPRLTAGLLGGLDLAESGLQKLVPSAKKSSQAFGRALQRVGSEQFRGNQ